MMLSVILPTKLMILLSSLKVIRLLTCGNNYIWLLNSIRTKEKLWIGAGNGLLISVLEEQT